MQLVELIIKKNPVSAINNGDKYPVSAINNGEVFKLVLLIMGKYPVSAINNGEVSN